MKNPSLFAPANLMIAVTLFGGMLFELYPKHEKLLLMQQSGTALKTQFSSPLQAEYAQLKVKQNTPTDQLLAMADKLSGQHFWQESDNLLKRLPSGVDQGSRQQADWLLLKNRLDAYYAATKKVEDGQAHPENAKQGVRTQLLALAKYRDWTPQTLTELAQHCADFGLFPQAATSYARLANLDTKQRQQWLTKAATWSGQAGEWGSAEQYLREAQGDKVSLNATPDAYAWMEAAIKAGKQTEVADYLHTIRANLPNEPEALKQLAAISLKLGEPAIAADAYQKLASANPAGAQTWNEKAAYWAQAAGLYQDAAKYLTQAQALAKQPAEQLSLQQRAIDLWVQAKQPSKAAVILNPLLAHPEYTESLLGRSVSVAFLAESQHQNKLATALWQWALPHIDDPAQWKHVAMWQGGLHRYAAALATWERIGHQFGENNQITLMRIQLHWELRQYRQAYQLAQHHHHELARLADAYQRSILVELAKKFEPHQQDLAMR